MGWVLLESVDGLFAVAAALTVACAVLTLYCTGMIYASLRTIRQWHQPLTAPIYVALGLASGAVLLRLLLAVFGEAAPWSAWLAIVCLVVGAALKWAYWLRIDGELRTYTAEAATGLGHLGKVRPLEPPHTPAQLRHARDGLSRRAQARAEAAQGWRWCSPSACPSPACCCRWCPAPASSARSLAVLSMALGPRRRALAVLRRGRARVDAVLRRGCGLRCVSGEW